jgi:hypothetical protein
MKFAALWTLLMVGLGSDMVVASDNSKLLESVTKGKAPL